LPDGSAIVAGGFTTGGDALSSVDLFQPGKGFTSAPAMNNARAGHSCTALADGRILAAGGTDGHGTPVGTAEIYDPAAQAWTVVADLNDPRWGHVAILLNNGRVLIAGGQDADGPKDTLELFEPKASAFVEVGVFDRLQNVFFLRNENSTGPADGGVVGPPSNSVVDFTNGSVFCGPWAGGKQTSLGVLEAAFDNLIFWNPENTSSGAIRFTGIRPDTANHQLAGLVAGTFIKQ
jgi:hypothetical protein